MNGGAILNSAKAAPPVPQRIAGREAESGDRTVRRSLPTSERRMIGAWCFLEHAGPNDLVTGGSLRVAPHPHAGVQAFTWMIEGELLHRDSLGNKQLIRPGEINLMTAGRGITHSEESPAGHASRIQAAQLWIALPDAMRHCAPSFVHYPDLPKLAFGGFNLTLLVGHLFGEDSPVSVHSPLIGIELITNGAAATTIPLRGDFEYGVLVLEGEAIVGGERLLPGELLYFGEHRTRLDVRCDGPSSLLLLGGKPLNERPLVWWNFVGRNRDEIVEYARQWQGGEHFGEVQGFVGPRMSVPVVPESRRQPVVVA